MRLTAQIFGVGAMISLFIGYQQNERKKLVAAKLSADAFWVVHYLLLGGIAGMIPNFIGIFREIVFINRENKKWADKVIWPAVFIIISWVMGIFTFRSAFNILPIAASTFVTVSLWLKNPIITKIITVPVCLAFLVYDVYVGSVIGIINESVSVISIIISFLKNIHNKKTA
ncbi:MAG TPA: hypothetical protein DDY61_04860 [Ruminococcaceae bacterium]|nr:hypothetical protein [Oscillospiraceae bacterium]